MTDPITPEEAEHVRRFRVYLACAGGPPLTSQKLATLEARHPDVDWREWLGLGEKSEPCENCGDPVRASLLEELSGLCALCDMGEQEQALADRDRGHQ